jgi:hypothetical protein
MLSQKIELISFEVFNHIYRFVGKHQSIYYMICRQEKQLIATISIYILMTI